MDNDKKKLKYEGKCHKKEAMRRKCKLRGKKKLYHEKVTTWQESTCNFNPITQDVTRMQHYYMRISQNFTLIPKKVAIWYENEKKRQSWANQQ